MRFVRFAFAFLGVSCLAVTVEGREVVTCKSPDGKFALRHVYSDQQPYTGDTTIIEVSTRKTILPLDSNWSIEGTAEHPLLQNGELKLLWSPDSQRVAYFAENGNELATRVFFRSGSSFNEIKLPELPSPKLPATATTESGADTTKRVEPMQWLKSGDLVLESEVLNDAWGRAASKITIGFDQENRASIRNVEQEKMSIVDYFLLLPADRFEGPPSVWLRHTRTGGHAYLCEAEPREKNIDEKNGYMSCGGDGAQASFDVALFLYRNGRPLLALCQAGEPEVEEERSVYSYLSFFELGADGKMHEITNSMTDDSSLSLALFPGVQREYDRWVAEGKGDWEFVLPRKGKTILVRAPKTKKILHKFTWTGEKFEKEK
jgi:hypothetical protein